jgi:hypothetical protein
VDEQSNVPWSEVNEQYELLILTLLCKYQKRGERFKGCVSIELQRKRLGPVELLKSQVAWEAYDVDPS